MRRLTRAGLGFALMLLPAVAQAQFINFDDLNTSPPAPDSGLCPVPLLSNGYLGFNWSNFYVLNGRDHYCMVPGGYRNGAVSSPNVAFNGSGTPASVSRTNPFTFNSVYLTAAWNNGLNVLVEGYLGPNRLYHQLLVLNTYVPTRFVFNWTGVDEMRFTSSGGTDGSYIGHGRQVAFDNMMMSPTVVPEPVTLLLLGTGLAGIGGVTRRRRPKNSQS